MHRSLRIAAAAALFACAAGAASAQVDARMMRQPDVSATEIVFVYAGDVWVVPKAGGEARRLSTPPGEEAFPRFSPDGKSIAYTANYDGNPDVYVLPAAGGEAKRVTNHPDVDRLVDWTPDGSLLVASPRESGRPDRFEKLFVVPAAGGAPKALPMPYGEFGAFSPDGSVLAYQPISTEFRSAVSQRGSPRKESYQRSEKPGGGNSSELALENDIGITMSAGRHRKASTSTPLVASRTRLTTSPPVRRSIATARSRRG